MRSPSQRLCPKNSNDCANHKTHNKVHNFTPSKAFETRSSNTKFNSKSSNKLLNKKLKQPAENSSKSPVRPCQNFNFTPKNRPRIKPTMTKHESRLANWSHCKNEYKNKSKYNVHKPISKNTKLREHLRSAKKKAKLHREAQQQVNRFRQLGNSQNSQDRASITHKSHFIRKAKL